MKKSLIAVALVVGLGYLASPHVLLADQRPRNPGGGGGSSDSGGSGGSSGGGSSGGGSGDSGGTGRVASPRGGGSSPWGDSGTVASRPSEPRPATTAGRRGGSRGASGVSGTSGRNGVAVPGYSRPRGDAPLSGYAVARRDIATLPPIISGPVFWGPDNWYFYPWGFGGLGLGYFWDPWMWSGFGSGYGGYGYGGYGRYGGYGYGGYGGGYIDPYWGGSGGGGYSSEGRRDDKDDKSPAANPLDSDLPTGGLRLKITPRDAEVYVDGYFAGRVDDFDGALQKLEIAEGSHKVELRAPGYETQTFDVMVVAGQTTTYRTDLERR